MPGTLALAAASFAAGVPSLIVSRGATSEAAAVAGLRVHGADSLGEAVRHLAGVQALALAEVTRLPDSQIQIHGPDLAEVEGQSLARRGLEIALAGRHNLALCGPPGIGKTLLLRCAPALLPPLEDDEAIEVSRIYSVAGLLDRRAPLLRERPFRAPHHTISTQALVGGGPRVRPGEASLAHRGVLLLDETLQFRSDALDALREPLEGGSVTIARVDGALTMPARFTLLAAFNPCPCGWRGSQRRACTCEDATARRYAARLSGPLRDRIDLWVSMGEARPAIAVAAARNRARRSRRGSPQHGDGSSSDRGSPTEIYRRACSMRHTASRRRRWRTSPARPPLRTLPRRLHRATRVARTIADLAAAEQVATEHLDEALVYRAAVQP